MGREFEKDVLEVEVFGRHLVDDCAGSGGREANRVAGRLEGHDGVGGDHFGGDALVGECKAQGLGLRGAEPDADLRALREVGERGR